MRTITCYVSEEFNNGLNELVRRKYYPSRSETIRSAIRDLLKNELRNIENRKPEPPPKKRRYGALRG